MKGMDCNSLLALVPQEWPYSSQKSPAFREYLGEVWRAVEGNHLSATRKLVESDAEHQILEKLLEQSKSPIPEDALPLHYFLYTPFRYPPLKYGSRFGRRFEKGIWYGSETPEASLAEIAYYRLLFLEGTEAKLEIIQTEYVAFRTTLKVSRCADLTLPPFQKYQADISSKIQHQHSQQLGTALRRIRTQAIRYCSARTEKNAYNLAVLDPESFAQQKPNTLDTWICFSEKSEIQFRKKNFFTYETLRFSRDTFLVGDCLPSPAL